MPPTRSTFFLAVHIFLLKDNKILLARRFQTGYEDGRYSVPAGHVEAGETPTEAAVREAQEETGIRILKKNLEFAHVMHRISHRQSVDFFFICREWEGEPCISEPDKCDKIMWTDIEKLPSNTIPYIKTAIKNVLKKQLFSETNL